ncbi:MAG: hypothetical protein H6R18_748 [Proteobacteria bacterium]|nr:hypothetical protein [Pseudomonadota bacterium]
MLLPLPRKILWLLIAALVLLLSWLALPRLLGFALERWMLVPGLAVERVDIASIGAGRASLRELRAVYRSAGGHHFQIALQDIAIDYSLARRHIDRLEIARAKIKVSTEKTSPPSPWPQLVWPRLPLGEVKIGDLQVAVQRPEQSALRIQGSLLLQQAVQGQLLVEFRKAADLLRLNITPGDVLEARAEWLPAAGSGASAGLHIGRQPTQQPAKLVAKVPLSALLAMGQALGVAVPLAEAHGEIALETELVLGQLTGEVCSLKGEVVFSDLASKTAAVAGQPFSAELAGKVRFAWQQADAKTQARIELQPGLTWRVQGEGQQPVQAFGRLDQVFVMGLGDDQAASKTEFPFTVRTARFGNWEGALKRLSFATGATPADLQEAHAQLRLKGQLPHWQNSALQVRGVKAEGDVGLDWSRLAGLSSEAKLKLDAERLVLAGKTPLTLLKSAWAVQLGAQAEAGSELLNKLELQGEISSQPLKIQRGADQTVALDSASLRIVRYQPVQQQGDFRLAAKAVRMGKWPAPDLQTRLQLKGQSLQADGTLQLQQTEVLRFSAIHALAKGCGQGSAAMKQHLPTLGKLLQSSSSLLSPLDLQAGDAEGRFDLNWCVQPGFVFDARGNMQARAASLGWERARLEGIDSSLQLDALQPLRGRVVLSSPRGQLATGTVLTDLKINLAMAAPKLNVQELQVKLLGGSLHGGPVAVDWPPDGQTLPVEIRHIDLAQLLELFKLQGLSGSGQLSGMLPLTYRDGGIEINDGRLNSLAGGTIKYAPDTAIPTNIGLQVLRNLHFQKLGTQIWYAQDGAYRAQIKLDGSNPDFYNGYPVRFGLNIKGALPGLFRAALFSGDFNRHILEQLQSGKLQ